MYGSKIFIPYSPRPIFPGELLCQKYLNRDHSAGLVEFEQLKLKSGGEINAINSDIQFPVNSSTGEMNFNPRIALNYAQQYSRPRQVGTREEHVIAQEIAGQVEQFGYSVQIQDFQFCAAFERVLVIEILLGLFLVLSAVLSSGKSQWFTLLPTGLLISLILMIGPLNRKIQKNSFGPEVNAGATSWASKIWKIGTRFQTRNIVAAMPDSPLDLNLPHLCLVAHYDSKSQYLPLVVRIVLFVILVAGSLVFSILNGFNFFAGSLTPLVFVTGILVIICGIPLLFLDYGNNSPGAIDDASGVGLVLHLAEIIANQPELIGKLGITVLITGAEELAVKGSLAYVQQNNSYLKSQAKRGGLHILNFDGIGVEGKLYIVGSDRGQAYGTGGELYCLVQQSAAEKGISIGRFSLPGAMFDHVPFAEAGFNAVSIIGIGKHSISVHTANDSPEKLHERGFDQAGRLALGVIENLSGE